MVQKDQYHDQTLNNNVTIVSSLNISGLTTLNNKVTLSSSSHQEGLL